MAYSSDAIWQVTNGEGLPISQAHYCSPPPSLLRARANYCEVMESMTKILSEFPFHDAFVKSPW